MSYQIFYFILVLSPALSKHLPRYTDLDEDDQRLFRAAYDTPAYNHDEYEESEDLPVGSLDLMKDGLWALKAKIKELKAFDKALAANMLSTKLKVKELLENHMGTLKKHHHVETYEKKKPYVYQILQCVLVTSRPVHNQQDEAKHINPEYDYNAQNIPKYENTANGHNEQVISVRITSSVAVGRRKDLKPVLNNPETTYENVFNEPISTTDDTTLISNTDHITNKDDFDIIRTDTPPNLIGANIEFIKQLNAKKEKGMHSAENIYPFQFNPKKDIEVYDNYNNHETKPTSEYEIKKVSYNDAQDTLPDIIPTEYYDYNSSNYDLKNNRSISEDSIAEPSIKSLYETNNETNENKNVPLARSLAVPSKHQFDKKNIIVRDSYQFQIQNIQHNRTDKSIPESLMKSVNNKNIENVDNIPIARSIPSNNYVQGLRNKPLSERGNGGSLTTVSFNIVHDTPNQNNFNEPKIDNKHFNDDENHQKNVYEPPKVYSQPAQIYSEPAKFYSEPAKIYSEPAKIYSEPAKIYSEPAKIYSEPAKFYSQPASLHLPPSVPPNYTPWQYTSQTLGVSSTSNTTPITTITNPSDLVNQQTNLAEHQPEKNYEVDEKISVLSEGRIHGIQETTTEKCKQDNCKVGYVVEGRQYKKYRVEERTSDGFIVGEYGVVRNEDGALRGVRYTADSDASPRLIYDALMKFLQLK